VVAGSGYTGGTAHYNSAGASANVAETGDDLIFGTPMVYWHAGEIEYHGFDNSQADREKNLRNVWADQAVLLWTSRCAVIGGRVDWALALDGGTG
jgi:hypothetical protein